MQELLTIIRFTYPHEAAIARGLLESEGIEVFTKDELTTQVHNFYSNAIGGIKLQVWGADYERAAGILRESSFANQMSYVKQEQEPALEKDTDRQYSGSKYLLLIVLLVLAAIFYFILLA